MFADVAYGISMWTMKALVVGEFVEWTPVRYRLSIRSGEWSADIERSARRL